MDTKKAYMLLIAYRLFFYLERELNIEALFLTYGQI
jgi:hypothetical protein